MWRVWLLAISACSFTGKNGGVPSDGSADAEPDAKLIDGKPIDAMPDAPQLCWSALGTTICLSSPPTGTIDVMTSTTFNTDTAVATNAVTGLTCAPSDTPTICAVAATTITIENGNTLTATGNKPLVLIAAGTVTIDGTVDVSGPSNGAASKPVNPACMPGTPPMGAKGGGGQGGSFGASGANGGNGTNMTNTGGIAGGQFTTLAIRAGCPGADGEGSAMTAGVPGGVVVVFGETITIGVTGAVDATGAGGGGGKKSKGGGGGGSGGLIVLDATTISVSGQLWANGGGGGGGGDGAGGSNTGGTGGASASPTSKPGGGPGADSNDGGDGYYLRTQTITSPTPGTNSTVGADGGGGGGGGAGVIKFFGTPTVSGTISPPPS